MNEVAPHQTVESVIGGPACDGEFRDSAFREIVVYLDGGAGDSSTLDFALAVAREHGARLTGVFIQPALTVSPAAAFARGSGMGPVLAAQHARLNGIGGERRTLFEAAACRDVIRTEWRIVPHLYASESVVHARYADLAVIARRDPADGEDAPPGLVTSLVLTSGRPIIVLPPRCATIGVRRVLVGWDARREAARAVADALPLLLRADLVEVLVVEPNGSGMSHGDEPGVDIARYLTRHSARVEVRRLASGDEPVGRVLLRRAREFGADLLVMGAYGHSRLSEWAFGGVTRTVLRDASCPALMSR